VEIWQNPARVGGLHVTVICCPAITRIACRNFDQSDREFRNTCLKQGWLLKNSLTRNLRSDFCGFPRREFFKQACAPGDLAKVRKRLARGGQHGE